MKGRKVIKRSLTLLLLFGAIFYSCIKESDRSKEIQYIVYEYVDFFKELKKLKKRDFVVNINVDSTNSKYIAYRIYMSPSLLEKSELPNKIDVYSNIKIAYFTKNIQDDVELKNKMISKLENEKFYKLDSMVIDSNYPEWVVLINRKTKKQLIEKDMRYYPLDSIINKHD